MTGEIDDSLQSISVRLDGKNYSYWSYVMKNFLKGKKIWGYVSGILGEPKDKKAENYADLLDVWEAKNSKIITWVNNSIEHSIGIQLAKYETAKEVWDHLARLYTQSSQNSISWNLIFELLNKKGLRGSILHRNPLPYVDLVVSELLAEEIRFKSQAGKGILSAPNPSVLAVPSRPPSNFENMPYSKVGIDEYSFCK
ncbi:hypothetical protein LWI29_037703 [Acer saccharum]|uniref:Retrotransposon Copia-like N-terminal domain-containing protein n=1 Tax=Acer saccharum TaxID=4024 RepID=A0AA39VMP4_ACESA|nr:hypothetical protein LWI29_037703 [Acer saccharum]